MSGGGCFGCSCLGCGGGGGGGGGGGWSCGIGGGGGWFGGWIATVVSSSFSGSIGVGGTFSFAAAISSGVVGTLSATSASLGTEPNSTATSVLAVIVTPHSVTSPAAAADTASPSRQLASGSPRYGWSARGVRIGYW